MSGTGYLGSRVREVWAAAYDSVEDAYRTFSDGYGGGGILRLPAGELNSGTTPSFDPFVLDIPGVEIWGAGFSAGVTGTILKNHDEPNADGIRIATDFAALRFLSYIGPGQAGTGRGIVFHKPGGSVRNCTLQDVFVDDTGSWGVEIVGTDTEAGCFGLINHLHHVMIRGGISNGALRIGKDTYITNIDGASIFEGAGQMIRSYWNNGLFVSGGTVIEPTTDAVPAVHLEAMSHVSLRDLHFEHDVQVSANHHFVSLVGGNTHIVVDGCRFIRGASITTPRVLKTSVGGPVHGLTLSNLHAMVGGDMSAADDDILFGNGGDRAVLGPHLRRSRTGFGGSEDMRVKSAGGYVARLGDRSRPMTLLQSEINNLTDVYAGEEVINASIGYKKQIFNGSTWETVTSA